MWNEYDQLCCPNCGKFPCCEPPCKKLTQGDREPTLKAGEWRRALDNFHRRATPTIDVTERLQKVIMPTKRYDITTQYNGDENTHGGLKKFQVQQMLDSMPEGAALTINRVADTDSNETYSIFTGETY